MGKKIKQYDVLLVDDDKNFAEEFSKTALLQYIKPKLSEKKLKKCILFACKGWYFRV